MPRCSIVAIALPVLLLAIGTQVTGLVIWHMQRAMVKHDIKQRIKAGVPADERVTFRLTIQQMHALDWVEQDREFRRDGRMFDVVARKVLGDGTIELSCIDDHQEAVLFAQLDDLTDRAMQDRIPLRRLSLPPGFTPGRALSLSLPASLAISTEVVSSSAQLAAGHARLPDPPPWG